MTWSYNLVKFAILAACIAAVQSVYAQNASEGWRILLNQRLGNCAACHSIPNEAGLKTGIQSTFGPQLDKVATRYDAPTLRQWVVDARKINPNTLMPPFGTILSAQQIDDVLAALQSLR
jgi:L-cysteine S-thiosulfotransferase